MLTAPKKFSENQTTEESPAENGLVEVDCAVFGNLVIDTNGSTFDTLLGIYTGTAVNP